MIAQNINAVSFELVETFYLRTDNQAAPQLTQFEMVRRES